MTGIINTNSNEGWEARGQQLLPGISNDVVLEQITPKLSWRAFLILSSLSRGWRDAIRRHEVYDARVRSHSTQTVILLELRRVRSYSRGVFIMRDQSYFELPPIPFRKGEIPWKSQCVSLDGKIYVLGGELYPNGQCSDEVFVLDVAGQRGWIECANMKRPRKGFGCGVIGGKIYVCGGTSSTSDAAQKYACQLPSESEVFDPEKNIWSSIKPMKSLRFDHVVEAVGEELFVHSGLLFDRIFFDSNGNRIASQFRRARLAGRAHFLEVYHPGKDEWRVVDPKRNQRKIFVRKQKFFSSEGKFFSLSTRKEHGIYDIHDIEVLDADEQSWTPLHSFSFARSLEPIGSGDFKIDVVPVDGELFAKLYRNDHCVYIRSRGFGSREITWHRAQPAPSSVDFPLRFSPFLRYPVEI